MVLKGGNIVFYQDFTPYITPFALLRIHTQQRQLANKSQSLPLYTHSFTNTMGLPYAHKIEVILFSCFNDNINLLNIFKVTLTNPKEPSLQRVQIDIKQWFEQLFRNQRLDETETKEAIDPLLLVHDLTMTQATRRPTDIQQNLRQKKEKKQSTCQKLS